MDLDPPSRHPGLAECALAALAFAALSLLYLRPIWHLFATHIAPDPGDPLFNLYILKWDVHQIRLGLPDLWNAPFFYPARRVLTYSDHLLGPAALAAALSLLGVGAVAAYNLLFLTSYAASGWSAWWVLRRSGLAPAAALFGGIAFAFSSFRWAQANHIQVLLTAAIPLVLWTWDRLLAAPGPRRAAAFLAAYLVHLSGGNYLAYMIHLPLLVLALNRARELQRQEPPLRRDHLRAVLRWAVPAAALAALAAVALFFPYLADRGALARSPGEFQTFGASLLSYFTPAGESYLSGLFPVRLKRHENELFAGLLPTALVLLALVTAWRESRRPAARLSRPRRTLLVALYTVAGAGWAIGEWKTLAAAGILHGHPPLGALDRYNGALLLALGALLTALALRRRWTGGWPFAGGEPAGDPSGGPAADPWPRGLALAGLATFLFSFPLVFQPLARIVPGLNGMRVPARFYPFVSFSLCFFAARALDRLTRAARRARLAWLAVALLAVELLPRPFPWTEVPGAHGFPPVVAWLAAQPDVHALLELPFQGETREISYMVLETGHWKPLVNGYSGHFPPAYLALRDTCCNPLPDGPALDRLRRWGVTHLLVHRRLLRRRWEIRAFRTWEAEAPVRLEYAARGDRVYRLLPPVRHPEGGTPPSGLPRKKSPEIQRPEASEIRGEWGEHHPKT